MFDMRSFITGRFGPSKGESDISSEKAKIDSKNERFDLVKKSRGEDITPKQPKAEVVEHIDAEKGKIIELNAEKLNVELESMMQDTKETEKQLNETLYGKGFFGKARKWFAENVVEKYLGGLKIEDFRMLKGAAKGLGGGAAFLFGLSTLNPLLATVGAKTAFDGLVEGIKYFHEGKMIREMRNAIFNKFEVLNTGAELRNKIKETVPTGEGMLAVDVQIMDRKDTRTHMEELIRATRDNNKIIAENFPILRKLERNYGMVRFVGGIVVSLGALGWVAALKEGAKHAVGGVAANKLINGTDLGAYDFDKNGISHHLIQYNDGVKYAYNGTEVMAKTAHSGWKCFDTIDLARQVGVDEQTIRAVASYGPGLHHIGPYKLEIIEKGGRLMHAIDFTPKIAGAGVHGASNLLSSVWDLAKTYGGALLYSGTTAALEGAQVAAKEAEMKKIVTPKEFTLSGSTYKKELDKAEKIYKEVKINDVIKSEGNISSPVAGASTKYFEILNKDDANNELEIIEIDPQTGKEIAGTKTKIAKAKLYPSSTDELVKKYDKTKDQIKEENNRKSKEKWELWLANEGNDIQLGNSVLLTEDNLLKDQKGKSIDKDKQWTITEINLEKGTANLQFNEEKILTGGKKKIVQRTMVVNLNDIKKILEGTDANKIDVGKITEPTKEEKEALKGWGQFIQKLIDGGKIEEDDKKSIKTNKSVFEYDTNRYIITKVSATDVKLIEVDDDNKYIRPPLRVAVNVDDFTADCEYTGESLKK